MSRNQSPSLSDSFLFQEHPVRAQLDGDQLWFVAKDVCGALGILWTGHSLDSIPECWQRVVRFTTHRRGNQSFKCINEPAVYKLAFRSSKPRAEAFTNWIASEVVPAIRKTGKYEAPKPHPVKKSEQLPLRPAALPALIDEKPFLEFIEEIQAAHEEVDRILSRLHHSVFTLSWKVAEALERRADIGCTLSRICCLRTHCAATCTRACTMTSGRHSPRRDDSLSSTAIPDTRCLASSGS